MHPQRTALHNELHARQSLYFDEPAHVHHLAVLGDDAACLALLQRCCPDAVDREAAQGITRLDGNPFKWERHAEFFTLTLVVPCATHDAGWQALPQVLAEAIAPQAHQVINAVQVLVHGEQGLDLTRYGFKDPCGSLVGGGDAVVWSDFRLTEDGTNRLLFVNRRAIAPPPSSVWSNWPRMSPTWATCCRRGCRWRWRSRTPRSCAASMPAPMPR